MRRLTKAAVGALSATAALLTTACTAGATDDADTVVVAVGYQSKTINTVTAGTLMRDLQLILTIRRPIHTGRPSRSWRRARTAALS